MKEIKAIYVAIIYKIFKTKKPLNKENQIQELQFLKRLTGV